MTHQNRPSDGALLAFLAGLAFAVSLFVPTGAKASPVPLVLTNGSGGFSFSRSAGLPGEIFANSYVFEVGQLSAGSGTAVSISLGVLNNLDILSADLAQLPGGTPPSGPYSFTPTVITPSFEFWVVQNVIMGPGTWMLSFTSTLAPGAAVGSIGGTMEVAGLASQLPEPTTLALVGLALLALSRAGRVKAFRQAT